MLARRLWVHAIVASAAVASGLTVAACNATPLPGTQLGTFKVTATTSTNSCGSGLAAPSPWVFDVQMSENDSLLYWSWMDGTPPLSGTLTSTTATVTNNTSANVDYTDAGNGPCTMDRNDALAITLATAASPTSFTATITYTFSAASGADCSDQLASAGGAYDAVPCTIEYSATGNRQ
jgi:hypothetical protein